MWHWYRPKRHHRRLIHSVVLYLNVVLIGQIDDSDPVASETRNAQSLDADDRYERGSYEMNAEAIGSGSRVAPLIVKAGVPG
jgi:hypothetical protein